MEKTSSIHTIKLAKLEEIAKKAGKEIPSGKTLEPQTFFWAGAGLQAEWEEYNGGTDIRYLF